MFMLWVRIWGLSRCNLWYPISSSWYGLTLALLALFQIALWNSQHLRDFPHHGSSRHLCWWQCSRSKAWNSSGKQDATLSFLVYLFTTWATCRRRWSSLATDEQPTLFLVSLFWPLLVCAVLLTKCWAWDCYRLWLHAAFSQKFRSNSSAFTFQRAMRTCGFAFKSA